MYINNVRENDGENNMRYRHHQSSAEKPFGTNLATNYTVGIGPIFTAFPCDTREKRVERERANFFLPPR